VADLRGRITIDGGNSFETNGQGDRIFVHSQGNASGLTGSLDTSTIPVLKGEQFQVYSKSNSPDIFVSLDPAFTGDFVTRVFSDGGSGSFPKTIYSANYAVNTLGYAPKTEAGQVPTFTFKLTDASLATLADRQVPSVVRDLLTPLKDQTFTS